jgi:diguanylate cyclase (GGDEF)-like protein
MLSRIFNPPADLSERRYLWLAVTVLSAVGIAASVAVSLAIQALLDQPNYLRAAASAVLVPLLVAPPLIFWVAKTHYRLGASKRRIEELGRLDSLTGLANRGHFFRAAQDCLTLAERHGHHVSLLLMDLDHFKAVNDSLGHQAGDEVLRLSAASLKGAMRGTDLLARYGGEEFVALLPHTDREAALRLAGRLRRGLAASQAGAGGRGAPVTMSVGVAAASQFGYDLERLLAEADRAMYQAKSLGRDRCVAAPALPAGCRLRPA